MKAKDAKQGAAKKTGAAPKEARQQAEKAMRRAKDAAARPAAAAGTISADKLCQLTGLTDRRHRQLAKAGWFPPPLRGHYEAGATVAGLFKYFREQLLKRDDRERQAAVRYKEAKAKTIEREYEILDNKYVAKDQIGPALRNISLHQRAVLQRKLEQELGPQLAGLTTLEILEKIKPTVDEICALFREGVAGWMDAPPPHPKAGKDAGAPSK